MKYVYCLWVRDFCVDGEWELLDLFETRVSATLAAGEYLNQYGEEDKDAVEFHVELRKVY